MFIFATRMSSLLVVFAIVLLLSVSNTNFYYPKNTFVTSFTIQSTTTKCYKSSPATTNHHHHNYNPRCRCSLLYMSNGNNANNSTDDSAFIGKSVFFQDDDSDEWCDFNDVNAEKTTVSSIKPKASPLQNNKNPITPAATPPSAIPKTPPERSMKKVMENIELRWSIDESSQDCKVDEDVSTCSEPCDECRGSGIVDCQFCDGTGWIDFGEQTPGTVGETLVKRNGGYSGTECPICSDDCTQLCAKCMGSGWIAKWRLQSKNLFNNTLHP